MNKLKITSYTEEVKIPINRLEPPRRITLRILKKWNVTLEELQGPSREGTLPFVRSMVAEAIVKAGWSQSVAAQEINRDRSVVSKQQKTWKRITRELKNG